MTVKIIRRSIGDGQPIPLAEIHNAIQTLVPGAEYTLHMAPEVPQTALDALRRFKKTHGPRLTIVNKHTQDRLLVLDFDAESGVIKLKNGKNHTFSSVFKEREDAHYLPVWE